MNIPLHFLLPVEEAAADAAKTLGVAEIADALGAPNSAEVPGAVKKVDAGKVVQENLMDNETAAA